jgi:hypothetical protein
VVLPDPASYLESGERFLHNAIPWSEVKALSFQPWTTGKWDRKSLAEASKRRVSEAPAFSKMEARAKLLKERRERTTMSLERSTWERDREADEKALDAVSLKLDEGPDRFVVDEVSYGAKTPGSDDARIKKRIVEWRENLAHDPWLEEALFVMKQMHGAP